ncbi:phosphotransferase family enzyme [Diaminobutyricimonas aerilata]|uniref:Phosphotransferase family enzyme n=1 Tax=Diaminobutyricimonas aerilata TaxID=1162967 RepID=A0A2M9CLP3_9MICO|nr:aminoglycoside phosphotransferase family protein [Diaminobutyricimonas aerilata]PJJ72817.1 phosphotransferase family enzyme [Diaminobutyricimonas aerilata]
MTEREVLAGGGMNVVERIGDRVHRPAGPWTPTVHRLLAHLRSRGIDWVPRPHGVDGDGREVLDFLPGESPDHPMPEWLWSDALLREAGLRLRRLHGATLGFDRAGAVWRMPAHEPAEVICHNDFAPYNFVVDAQRRLTGVIDFDTASPGPRRWDLAYLAYRLVPLGVGEVDPGSPIDGAERRRRLHLLCAAYGDADPDDVLTAVVPRLRELADFSELRAPQEGAHLLGHARLYRDDADAVAALLDR